ncbi:hypothetical protein GN956_G23613 [Arapaima gigas]
MKLNEGTKTSDFRQEIHPPDAVDKPRGGNPFPMASLQQIVARTKITMTTRGNAGEARATSELVLHATRKL